MKLRNQGHFPEPVSPEQLAFDDALLDSLAAGEPAPEDDSLAVMLSAWNASLSADPISEPVPVSPTPVVRRRRPLSARLVAAIAGAVVILGGGLTAGAANAGPGSPLWPITKIVYADRAGSRAAMQEATAFLDQATTAYADRRFADALDLTNKAAALLPKVTDAADRQRLTSRIERLRAALAAVTLPVPGASPSAPSGVAPSPNPSGVTPSTTPRPSTSPSPSTSQGGLLPPLPSILPSLPLIG
jgi:hypothetical protein